MAYHRWPWLAEGEDGGRLGADAEELFSATAADLFGEGGYPALFSLTDGLGFFAIGPGEGLLYYFDRRRDTAFLFPRPVK